MARRFRIYGKKRGDRRTGSKRLGSYGELFFYGIFLVLGAGSFYLLLINLIWPEWQANRHFVEHQCEVVNRIVTPVQYDGRTRYRPEILIRCEIDGQPYATWTYDISSNSNTGVGLFDRAEAEAIVAQFEIGKQYYCWYDPARPQTVILVRGYSWWMWLLLIVPASFALFGSVGVVRAALHSSASAERRASIASKAASIDLLNDGAARGIDFPNIPPQFHVTDSPGTHLAYRLPVDASTGWQLAGMWGVCLLWNGIVVWLVAMNVGNHFAGHGDWLLSAMLLPFGVAGIGIFVHCLRQSRFATAMGPTRLEISGHPLYPGRSYELYLSQAGRMELQQLTVTLVCDEQATYRQGTDTRTETRCVYEETIYARTKLSVGADRLFEDTCQFAIPESAMHSFRSAHNQIQWKLVVQAELSTPFDYERRFPIVVYPLQELASTSDSSPRVANARSSAP